MAAKTYQVTRVQQTVYLDDENKAVQGYALTVELLEFGETITVNVPDTDPDTAKAKISQLLKNRRRLADLSEE